MVNIAKRLFGLEKPEPPKEVIEPVEVKTEPIKENVESVEEKYEPVEENIKYVPKEIDENGD
tara:strand:- start:412 stop:597 length:186 start_codon:yes stop_codon:yes gene_type:complete